MQSVETVDPAALSAPTGATLAPELIARAVAISGSKPQATVSAPLPDDLRAALDACEARARRLGEGSGSGWGQAAAVDFLGDAITAIAVDHQLEPGEARAAVVAAAEQLDLPAETATFAVFRRALASTRFTQLPPTVAAEIALGLLVELAPAAASSLWIVDAAGSSTCLVSLGDASQGQRLEEVARAALDGVLSASPLVRAHVVERWDRPYAALVVRGRTPSGAEQLDPYLAEAAAALAPLLERASLFDRSVHREHELVSAGERRLVRLGYDLHDGPLQEIVALAQELRLAATDISQVVTDGYQQRVSGRFDDILARLGALDESLREIARSIRSTTAVARPVAEAVDTEVRALRRATGMKVGVEIEGDLSDLSDSQKIVLYRVVQEALSNVRKHSGAATVAISLRGTPTYVSLSVADNGYGFDPEKLGSDRLGLAGISERVRLLGGAVEIETKPGDGTTIRATLPHWSPSVPAAAAVYAAASPDTAAGSTPLLS
jgi:signal transduction histidine kinase